MKLQIKNWSIEIMYEKVGILKMFFMLFGHDKWRSKKTYVFYKYNEYTKNNIFKEFKNVKILRWPKWFNLSSFYMDINKYNIPFMFQFIFDKDS
jgi:hypothetical protein